ncbi:J domain-containing protein [Pseudomonas sp. NFX183]|uniref:J domain-containing protein n=1 Tax=Pseudomonas sp. NFX183 TaxID=3399573 RepID=UPI003A5C258A
MTCWDVLGLSPNVDSRTIKRQYATLLKKTRPDDDPQGFQRLREAYEHALSWQQWAQEDDSAELAVVTVPTALAAETLQAHYRLANRLRHLAAVARDCAGLPRRSAVPVALASGRISGRCGRRIGLVDGLHGRWRTGLAGVAPVGAWAARAG